MATYRNQYANYFSDKGGMHTPVGTILPVFVGTDQQTSGEDPDYTYRKHLYCDGRELLIRDYPELYSIIRNKYGGATGVTRIDAANPGGLRRSYIINNKVFFQFYKDATNDKVNVQMPYPYNAAMRFEDLGGFPTTNDPVNNPVLFNTVTFYSLIEPTEDVSSFAQTGEFAYELVFPDSVDVSTFPTGPYTLTFAGGGAPHPNLVVQKSFTTKDYPYNIGTFNLPDYRQRKILGFGNVNGAGTATPENAINNFVGQTGGQWYIAKNTLIDSGSFFTVGDVKTTGYTDIVADISAYVIGSVEYKVGPIDDHVFSFPPAHNHRILSVEVDQTKTAELGPSEVDKYAVNYIDSRANISQFEPEGAAGSALGHSHGVLGTALQSAAMATYGNVPGIGDKDVNYNYSVSEAASTPLISVTYDSNTGFITVNTNGNHGFNSGDNVSISGVTPIEYSGAFTVIPDGLSAESFNVLPRTGEVPNVSTGVLGAGANVKLSAGYFVEQEITQPPRAYVVDGNTLVGGKQAEFEIPGNAITLKEETITGQGSAVISTPDPNLGEVIGIEIIMTAGGGGGADSDNDGTDGLNAQVTLDVDGTLYTISANGGKGGTAGNSGGAGGQGGTLSIPAALANDDRFNISVVDGIDGANGGGAGSATAVTLGGGASSSPPLGNKGGNGLSTSFQSTTNNPNQQYTNNGSFNIPAPVAGEIARALTIKVAGAGGGPGNPNANSGCSGSWPGWPTSTSGKSGAVGGYGGRGALLEGTLQLQGGTLTWELGTGGGDGFNNKDGNTGTGSEAGPSSGGQGAAGTVGGQGAVGAWGNGGTGGGGGGSTGLFLDGVLIAGAGGGGGGGGSGGGFNGGGTTDGCYEGGNHRSATTSLINSTSALDFADGANGGAGGCTAGGGGGGGCGVGVIGGAQGGVGGAAGVGHNGNGGGTGGRRGASAYRSDYWSGGMSLTNQGAAPSSKGYVEIQYSVTTLEYDPVGGGGGSGAQISIEINDINVPVAVSLGSAGQGGGAAGDGGTGQIYVRYAGQEAGTTLPGETTVPSGKYYNCSSDGTPSGAALDGAIWQSSTDDNLKQRAFGVGTGSTAGFGSTGIPFAGQNKISQYIAFTGAATDAGNDRQLVVGQLALSTVNTVRFTVIRGSNQNGGEPPDEALNLYYQKSGSTNTTLFSEIILPSNNQVGWQAIDIPIPEGSGIRDDNITLILSQDRPAGANDNNSSTVDNYGLAAITLFYDPTIQNTFVATGGATLPGNLDDAGLPINSDEGINQVRREVTAQDAALTVTDGTFTMSSSTPIVTTAEVIAENDIPLITKYHRVKYLIKAF